MTDSILDGIKNHLETCPLFEGKSLRVNCLGEEPVEYTLEDVPSTTIVKRYIGGDSVRQALFLIASREFYSKSAIDNLKACGFYEQLADWFESQSAAGILPELPQGMESRRIEATTNGYCMAADIQQNVQRYQIQCKLTYYKEATT